MDPSPPRHRIVVDASSWTGVDHTRAYRVPASVLPRYPRWLPILPGWILDVILLSLIVSILHAARFDPDAALVVEHRRGMVETAEVRRSAERYRLPGTSHSWLRIRLADDPRTYLYAMDRTAAASLSAALKPGAQVDLGLSSSGDVVTATVNGATLLSQVHGAAEIRWLERRRSFWLLVLAIPIAALWIWWMASRLRGRRR